MNVLIHIQDKIRGGRGEEAACLRNMKNRRIKYNLKRRNLRKSGTSKVHTLIHCILTISFKFTISILTNIVVKSSLKKHKNHLFVAKLRSDI